MSRQNFLDIIGSIQRAMETISYWLYGFIFKFYFTIFCGLYSNWIKVKFAQSCSYSAHSNTGWDVWVLRKTGNLFLTMIRVFLRNILYLNIRLMTKQRQTARRGREAKQDHFLIDTGGSPFSLLLHPILIPSGIPWHLPRKPLMSHSHAKSKHHHHKGIRHPQSFA